MNPVIIEKATYQAPYIWLIDKDGNKKLEVGTINQHAEKHGLLRVARNKAISKGLIVDFDKEHIRMKSGEKIKIPRRKLKSILSELKKGQ